MHISGALLGGALMLACLTAAGCASRNDPHFNPYAPTSSGRSLIDRVDGVITAGEHALDNLDGYIDNTID